MKKLDFNSFVEMRDYVKTHQDDYEEGDKVIVHNSRILKTDKPHDIEIIIRFE